MKLRLLPIILVFIIFLSSPIVTPAQDIKLFVDSKEITCDVPPVIRDDRTLVPARALFEGLGASVKWNGVKKQVTIRLDNTTILLTINSKTAQVNLVEKELDTPPIIINDRTLLPVRFIAETLGAEVFWDDSNRSVLIRTEDEDEILPDSDNTIKSIVYSVSGKTFTLKFTFSSPLKNQHLYNLDNPVRTVLELEGATFSGSKTITVGDGGIKQIRMANHDGFYKIVADLDDVLKKNFVLASNKLSATLTFTMNSVLSDPSSVTSDITSTTTPEEPEIEIIEDKYWEVTDDSIVVLDAGHGGSDVGAIGYDENGDKLLYEKDLNLSITLEVAEILKENGVNVILTRSTDTAMSLSSRYNISNNNNALLYVSIHHNSHTSEASGSLTLYSKRKDIKYPNLKSSKSIAEIIQKHLVKETNLYDGGIRSEDDLAVLRGTETAAVLVEVAFISDYEDQKFLLQKDNLSLAAKGIANGILEVLDK